ncbi:hypothetical protein LP414_09350 [Polaromonas sp. P1(28)-13]|nr:hypothetical protein LP414_09350 [Polaromonas sp. P1(28)-13]
MKSNVCYSNNAPNSKKSCRPIAVHQSTNNFPSLSKDCNIGALCTRIANVGPPDNERVYGYVVRSVRPNNGKYVQRGSAPNFEGGLITLCTCKHSMRASLSPDEWKKGVWVAGLTSWDLDFGKQQSLVYLMRVGEAYASQAGLVHELRHSGRSAIVEAKNSARHILGDLMTPAKASFSVADQFQASAYSIPILGHSHRQTEAGTEWQNDIDYLSRGGGRPAMLVGDVDYSFIWTRPMVRRRNPAHSRPYRKWTLSSFLDDIEAVPE